MRAAPLISLVSLLMIFLGGIAHAQKQERTLMERINAPDPNMEFDVRRLSMGGRAYKSKPAGVREFYFQQKTAPKTFQAGEYATRESWFSKLKFWSKDAPTKGKYAIPNADRAADTRAAETKTMETKAMDVSQARESKKTMATREVYDGRREFLGKEHDKLSTALDPSRTPTITNQLKEIKTIDDVRELLNKNK